MKNRVRGERGFTLVEVMVSMLLLALVAGAVFSFYQLVTKAQAMAQDRASATLAMQSVVDRVKGQADKFFDLYDQSVREFHDVYALLGEESSDFQCTGKAEAVGGFDPGELLQLTINLSKKGKIIHSVTFYLVRGGY